MVSDIKRAAGEVPSSDGACEWPNCTKRAKAGGRHCGRHEQQQLRVALAMTIREGPVALSRHSATDAEIYEYAETHRPPASRQYQPDFTNTLTYCGDCGGPLVVFNLPNPDDELPPPHAAVCACCSFPGCWHCMWHGELVDGHTPGADRRCGRCGEAVPQ